MAAGHGGKRPGAGRKPAGTAPRPRARPPTRYADALHYLQAVVRGDEIGDPLRVAAARIILPFEQPKRRAKKPSPAPAELVARAEREQVDAVLDAWQAKADKIRARLEGIDDEQ